MKHNIRSQTESNRAAVMAPSAIRTIAEEGMGRPDVVPLYFGEGSWPTSDLATKAAQEALAQGDHFYLPNNGRPTLRIAIAEYLSALHNANIGPDRISVTSSGTQALALTAQVLVDPGDKVLCLRPAWPNIAGAFTIAGADVSYIDVLPVDGRWHLDLTPVLNAIAAGLRVVVINSPSNPTGWTLPKEDLKTLLDACRTNDTWLVVDEVYSRLYRHGNAAPSVLDIAKPDDKIISINSFSKAWSMTGWRLGWIVAPSDLEGTLGKMIEFNTACAPGFVQAGGERMIREGEAEISLLQSRIASGYKLVSEALGRLEGVNFVEPDGAFYAFFSVEGVSDSVETARQVLRETGIGLAPGVAFGPNGEGWFRLCYAQPEDVLKNAMDRLAPALSAKRIKAGAA